MQQIMELIRVCNTHGYTVDIYIKSSVMCFDVKHDVNGHPVKYLSTKIHILHKEGALTQFIADIENYAKNPIKSNCITDWLIGRGFVLNRNGSHVLEIRENVSIVVDCSFTSCINIEIYVDHATNISYLNYFYNVPNDLDTLVAHANGWITLLKTIA